MAIGGLGDSPHPARASIPAIAPAQVALRAHRPDRRTTGRCDQPRSGYSLTSVDAIGGETGSAPPALSRAPRGGAAEPAPGLERAAYGRALPIDVRSMWTEIGR